MTNLIAKLESAAEGSRGDPAFFRCGCGKVSRPTQLGPDGHCPKCGFDDDLVEYYWRAREAEDAEDV